MTKTDITKRLDPLRKKIDDCLHRLILEDSEVTQQISLYSLEGGGKRLRPIIFCLSIQALGKKLNKKLLETSAAFEFLHMASLLHDDIVDNSDYRRGRKAAHLVFGLSGTVLVGDYLLAKAADLAIKTSKQNCAAILAKTVKNLSLGELQQLKRLHQTDLSEKEYYDIIYQKTASLIESSTEVACIMAEASAAHKNILKHYGKQIGLAFQIIDDLLDYQGCVQEVGKPVAQDLKEGKITLPFIIARDRANSRDKESLIALSNQNILDDNSYAQILNLVHKYNAIELTYNIAEKLINSAITQLQKLPASKSREDLISLAIYVMKRDR